MPLVTSRMKSLAVDSEERRLAFRFLNLPLELREMVYDYIPLPQSMNYELSPDTDNNLCFKLKIHWLNHSEELAQAYGELRSKVISPPQSGGHASALDLKSPPITSSLKEYDDWVRNLGYLSYEIYDFEHARRVPIMPRSWRGR